MLTYEQVKTLVEKRLIQKTDDTPFDEFSELLFGVQYSESEVRRRLHGMKTLIDIIENQKQSHVAVKILSLSDLHVPFQLDYEILKDYRSSIDVLQLNGDIVDCQALSRFTKQYRISPMEELIAGRQYLIELIEYLKPKKVLCNYGNHDKRFSAYFAKNLDTDILELLPNTSLELIFVDGFRHYDKQHKVKMQYDPLTAVFPDTDIEFVDDWKSRIGKTIFAHPLTARSGILSTASRAKAYFQDVEKEPFDCICLAHTHRIGDSTVGYIRLLEQGAFADVNQMDYTDGRLTTPQKSGFAIICQDKDGNLVQEESKVITI